MAEERRDAASDDGFDADELRAFAEVRRALEAVEREQGDVRREGRRLRGQLEALLAALREDAVVLIFDGDRELIEASGCVRDHLGIGADDLVADFEEFADEETVEALDEANRAVLDGEPGGACVSDGFLKAGEEELATTFVHVARTDPDGEIRGIEAIGIIAPASEAEAELEEAADPFEPLLEHIARRLLADPSTSGVERAIRTLGDFLVADRVVVNEYDDADRAFSVMAAWLRPGARPLAAEERGISISELPWAYSALGAGESIIISADADLPREAARERELYAGDAAASSLLVPIIRHDALAGFVSIQSIAEERTWDETDEARARLFGIILTAALAQADAESALTQAREEAALAAAARADIETAFADARDEVQRLEEGRAAARSEIEAFEQQESSLRKELDEAREKADEAERGREDARRELSDTRAELEKTEEDAEQARRRAEDASANGLAARDELDGLRQRFDELEREAAELRAAAADARPAFSPAEASPVDDDAEPAGWSFGDSADQRGTTVGADDAAGTGYADRADDAAGTDDADGTDNENGTDDADVTDRPARDWQPMAGKDQADEPGFDPDATIEMTAARGRRFGFDPDATIEMDATRAEMLTPPDTDDEEPRDDAARDRRTSRSEGSFDAGEGLGTESHGVLEPTQSGTGADTAADTFADTAADTAADTFADTAAPSRWKDDKVSWEDSTDEVPLPRFLGGERAAESVDEVDAEGTLQGGEETTVPELDAFEADADEISDDPSDRPWWRRDKADSVDEAGTVGDIEAGEHLDGASAASGEADLNDDFDVAQQRTSSWDERLIDDAAVLDDVEEEGLPGLPGVEVERGLAEVGGNVELYRNLLTKFRSDYLGAADKIASAIEKGNIEVAHLLLHAVKGVAGVLGAENVRTNADELETQLIGGDPSATRAAVDGFSGALREVLDGIDMLDGNTFALLPETAPADSELSDAEQPPTTASSSSRASDPLVLRSYLSGLRPHITARKPRQCMLVMREVTARTWTDEYNERVAELAQLIEEGDFETATDSYRDLMERLESV